MYCLLSIFQVKFSRMARTTDSFYLEHFAMHVALQLLTLQPCIDSKLTDQIDGSQYSEVLLHSTLFFWQHLRSTSFMRLTRSFIHSTRSLSKYATSTLQTRSNLLTTTCVVLVIVLCRAFETTDPAAMHASLPRLRQMNSYSLESQIPQYVRLSIVRNSFLNTFAFSCFAT